MFAILCAMVFGIALAASVATIWSMFAAYGDKMIAALRMEHVPLATIKRTQNYDRIRVARTILTPRASPSPARDIAHAA